MHYYPIYFQNTREVTILETKNFKDVAYIEVGAMMIGKIVNEDVSKFKRGDEKGHFEFGGSTCIMLFEKDKIKPNINIIKRSETKLSEKIDELYKTAIETKELIIVE